MLKFLRWSVPFMVAGLLYTYGYHNGSLAKDAEWKEIVTNEYIQKVEATESTQRAINKISAHYQEEIAALEGSTDRVINDLRKSNKRLSVRIKASTRGTEGECRCVSNGRAELDERDAKRIIGVTQKGDLWIKSLQDTVRALQGELEEMHGNTK